jgi:hypothetical protein
MFDHDLMQTHLFGSRKLKLNGELELVAHLQSKNVLKMS